MTGHQPLGQTLRGQYARREMMIRSQLRQSINAELARISGCSTARMRWSLQEYLDDIFFGLGIRFAWVRYLLFANLSRHTGLARIMHITTLWNTGVIYFARVTPEEHEAALRDPLSAAPGPLHLGLPEWYGRSDIKARRYRPITNPLGLPYKYERNGPKSAKTVSDEAEAAAEAEVREAKERIVAAQLEDIEDFSDEEERRELVRRELRARAAGELSSDPIEEWG
ncbi:hypothetical protein GSI_00061 [Ganoderma sinense ZZ0214-1]|uniref:Uncharacterized protein n=1 Tax=Ganoderma sinense ZZ0214-1 TaxID=1077348 RepID=A0A2G8SRN0_9APHY|nr:hypothetical protein GSI_00061 [Ganoderma sinense ZZ0214-1]